MSAQKYGPAIADPLTPGEFRWRPYGFVERAQVPGPREKNAEPEYNTIVSIVSPDIPREDIATQDANGRWSVLRQWREFVRPPLIRSRWMRYGALVGAVVFSVPGFLGLYVFPSAFAPLAVVGAMFAVVAGNAVFQVGQRKSRKASDERYGKAGYATVLMALEVPGYGDMLRQFDQVAEGWTRGRVTDTSWRAVRLAVAAAIEENAAHRTAADEANAEYVTAMGKLQSVRKDMGSLGLG